MPFRIRVESVKHPRQWHSKHRFPVLNGALAFAKVVAQYYSRFINARSERRSLNFNYCIEDRRWGG